MLKFLAMTSPKPSEEEAAENVIPARPNHAVRYRTLFAELAANVFEGWPYKTAIYGIAGSLNQQLALAQKAAIPKDAFEAAIRAPFALGYIFGGAAWYADRYALRRPSPEADKVVLAAYREALGSPTDTELATISAEAARSPEFKDGMAVANADFEALFAGRAPGAFGLRSGHLDCP
jgi:hypothetical protein